MHALSIPEAVKKNPFRSCTAAPACLECTTTLRRHSVLQLAVQLQYGKQLQTT